ARICFAPLRARFPLSYTLRFVLRQARLVEAVGRGYEALCGKTHKRSCSVFQGFEKFDRLPVK
ncbi:MAG TPA: hypothetical protein VFI45_08970, partial [Candidatus Acidoferrum sp.]|nr:hypothetical protein [Candidatus Acidoferrum sp.]